MNVGNALVEEAVEAFYQTVHLDPELVGPHNRAVDRCIEGRGVTACRKNADSFHSSDGTAGRCSRRGNVALQRVIHHHAVGVKSPTERSNGPLHAFDPAARQSIVVSLVVERDDFFP